MPQNRLFIGIDDTDCSSSKGTGELTKILAKQIESNGLGKVVNITRHQLYLSKKIKYTNLNNSACLEVIVCNMESLVSFCKNFVKNNCQKLSNATIIFANEENISTEIIDFSLKVKKEVVTIKEAITLAKKNNLCVDFFGIKKSGVIGALAAIGLRLTSNDGRVIWANGFEVPNMNGTYIAGEVYCQTHVDTIKTSDGYKIPTNSKIIYDNKFSKPIIENNLITLIVEEVSDNELKNSDNIEAISSSFKISVN